MCSTCELTFSQNKAILCTYYKEASTLLVIILITWMEQWKRMICIKFSHKQRYILVHESSVKIQPLVLRKDVSDERCL